MQFRQTINTIGVFYQAMFIPIMLTVTNAIKCFKHPTWTDGTVRQSMASAPSVVCWEGGAHVGVLFMGIFGLVVLVGVFLSAYLYILLIMPKKTLEDPHFFVTFKFMIQRFRAARWYWGFVYLLRSMFCALIVTIDVSDLAHKLTIFLVLLAYALVSCYEWPWRNYAFNLIDVVMTFGILLICMCSLASTGVRDRAVTELVDYAAVTGFVIGLAPIFLVFGQTVVAELKTRFDVTFRGKNEKKYDDMVLARSALMAKIIGALRQLDNFEMGILIAGMDEVEAGRLDTILRTILFELSSAEEINTVLGSYALKRVKLTTMYVAAKDGEKDSEEFANGSKRMSEMAADSAETASQRIRRLRETAPEKWETPEDAKLPSDPKDFVHETNSRSGSKNSFCHKDHANDDAVGKVLPPSQTFGDPTGGAGSKNSQGAAKV